MSVLSKDKLCSHSYSLDFLVLIKKITSQKNKLAFVFLDMASLFQIHIDIPRTNPLIPLFQQPLVQEVREVLNVLSPSPLIPLRHLTCVDMRWILPLPPRAPLWLDMTEPDMELWSFQSIFLCILLYLCNKPVG